MEEGKRRGGRMGKSGNRGEGEEERGRIGEKEKREGGK